MKDLLKLNLQNFAEEGDDTSEKVESEEVEQDEGTEEESEEKLFTQAELEQKLKERLAREKRKADREIEEAKKEAQRQKDEEEGNFKELFESTQAELQELKQEKAQRDRHEDLLNRLKEHGLNEEQANKGALRLSKYVTDDDIESEVLEYASDFKASHTVDPSPGRIGVRKDATPVDDEEYGIKMLDAVRGLKKTRFN